MLAKLLMLVNEREDEKQRYLMQKCKHKTDFGRRAFSSAAPQIWNHIPIAIRVSASLDSFKHHLKTHYFASP